MIVILKMVKGFKLIVFNNLLVNGFSRFIIRELGNNNNLEFNVEKLCKFCK